MGSNAPVLCLVCGHAMNIAESNRAEIDLNGFERQKLECSNCGGSDSRFVFVSAKVDGTSLSAVERPASIVANLWTSLRPRGDVPAIATNQARPRFVWPWSGRSPAAEPTSLLSGPPFSEFHFTVSPFAELQTAEPGIVEKGPLAKDIANLVQSYVTKWRGR